MKRFWQIFDLTSLCFLFASGFVMSYLVITASFNGWETVVSFNDYKEGMAELILIPLTTLMGIVTTARYVIRNFWKGD